MWSGGDFVKTVPIVSYNVSQILFPRVNVVVCVCSNANPLHTMRFRLHARRIDGIKCGLFLNYAPLGQTALCVGRVSV